ncbi:MAG TPA: metallophosphoesterase [Burkholderiales bacterium]|nr:metallophosphoesterase [Burkholderiales bacterium]
MNMLRAVALTLTIALGVLIGIPTAHAAQNRLLVVISDLHLGVGRQSDGSWDPSEDFRWGKALAGFLAEISRQGGDAVDLVIAGDFLELWQPPRDIACEGDGADLGCTVGEMKALVARVLTAHRADLAALADFAGRGSNRVHLIPGNHDSSLLLPEVWSLVVDALGIPSERVVLVETGLWSSANGQVLIEHGHQIGSDVNRYATWPKITARQDQNDYVIRPWGERFVQQLFNAEEREYPIIDNLGPETAGARYRMADRGLWKSAADVARFIAFNLFETSIAQKSAVLGEQGDAQADAQACTRELGFRLFTQALKPDDALRRQIEADSEEGRALRAALDAQARELSEEDLLHLCAQRTETETLGAAIESKLVPRSEILRRHVGERLKSYPRASVFVYGHTHQLEEPWPLRINLERELIVTNTGAFQRLVDEPGFLERAKGFASPQEALRRMRPEDLAPCYSAVLISYRNGAPAANTVLWHMPENGAGKLVGPGSAACR